MEKKEFEIMEPYPSDFDEPKKEAEEKPEFDFSEEPATMLAISPYLEYIGERWHGPARAIEALRKRYKITEDEQEKEWIKKMAVMLKGEAVPAAKTGEAERWLDKMIKDKRAQVADAQRQSDSEMAETYEEEERELENLLRNVKEGKWDDIDIESGQSPLLRCMQDAEQTAAYHKEHGNKKVAEQAEKKLRALGQIRAMIQRKK